MDIVDRTEGGGAGLDQPCDPSHPTVWSADLRIGPGLADFFLRRFCGKSLVHSKLIKRHTPGYSETAGNPAFTTCQKIAISRHHGCVVRKAPLCQTSLV
jgi:hypothetical protein